jgi:hypothetical protein
LSVEAIHAAGAGAVNERRVMRAEEQSAQHLAERAVVIFDLLISGLILNV